MLHHSLRIDFSSRRMPRSGQHNFFSSPVATTAATLLSNPDVYWIVHHPLPGAHTPDMSSAAVTFAQDKNNQQRFLSELKDLLRIPSVSTLPQHKNDLLRAAQFLADELKRIGMENVEIISTAGHPLVYCDWLKAPGKPTVLSYGHYDVQPPDPLDEWKTPPFE